MADGVTLLGHPALLWSIQCYIWILNSFCMDTVDHSMSFNVLFNLFNELQNPVLKILFRLLCSNGLEPNRLGAVESLIYSETR